MVKFCPRCKKDKDTSFFYKTFNRFSSYCKGCQKQNSAQNYSEKKEDILIYKKNYYHNNRKRISNRNSLHYSENRESKLEYAKQNKERINEYRRKKRQEDLQFRLANNLRSRFSQAFKKGYCGSVAITELGCSIIELEDYLESLFQEGMSWNNYGTEWHIDHIIPMAALDLRDPRQRKKACHYTNLQPLFAQDNLKKGKKL
jgi:Prasinovirus endonuclease VII